MDAHTLSAFGTPTGIGQVTSIRTLERQIRRLKASNYKELQKSQQNSEMPAQHQRLAPGTTNPLRTLWPPRSTPRRSGRVSPAHAR